MKNRIKISIIIIIALALVAGLFFIFKKGKVVKEYKIVFTKEGFSPNSIIINEGDVVFFQNNSSGEFWPASDLHPTHGIYSEFDPRQPVESGKSWSFKFDKIGVWKYHDHLFSSYRGVITVTNDKPVNDKNESDDGLSAVSKCKDADSKLQCWEKLIDSALNKKGADGAFAVLAQFYSAEPSLAGDCHSFAHKIGQSAYTKFAKGEDIALTSKTSYCGYGFYHGFMETLLQSEGNANRAKDFCLYVGKRLANETSDAEGACYHGIGHGAVDGGDPRAWGNPQAMINPAMKMCESFATGHYLYRCVTGAYNALEILAGDPKYKLDMIAKDPFWLCPSQSPAYREGCYTNMLPALMRLTNNNYPRMFSIIEKISDPSETYDSRYSVREITVLSLAHELLRMSWTDPDYISKTIGQCHSLKSRLACIEGLAGGHMKYGEPEKEHVKGLAFCSSSELRPDERGVCYRHILSRLRIWYSQEKAKEICSGIEPEYKKFCQI